MSAQASIASNAVAAVDGLSAQATGGAADIGLGRCLKVWCRGHGESSHTVFRLHRAISNLGWGARNHGDAVTHLYRR